MDLNTPETSEDERAAAPKDDCVILEVKQQPKKRRKPKKIAQHKKRRGKARVVAPPSRLRSVPTTDVAVMGGSERKRYDSESEEAVSDTESEDDAAGKEGRLQRRAIKRNKKCITDSKELKRFEALPPDQQVLYAPKRARKQTPVLNIATTKGVANKTYEESRAEDEEDSMSSEHDTDEEYKQRAQENPPPLVVPPKKRKMSAESLPNKRRSLDDILKQVSVPISPPAPPVTPPAPPSTVVPPATPPLKSAPVKKSVAFASWRQPQAPQPVIETVALGRPIHGDVGMLNTSRAPQQQPPQAPQQPASKLGTLVYYDAWALKGFPAHPLADKALAERDRIEYVKQNTTTEPVLGALPRSLVEYVREPLPSPAAPPPAAHLLPSGPPAWPALQWERRRATPPAPSRAWHPSGPRIQRPRSSPPRDRHDPRFEPRFGPRSDRERCFDWRFDRGRNDRRPR